MAAEKLTSFLKKPWAAERCPADNTVAIWNIRKRWPSSPARRSNPGGLHRFFEIQGTNGTALVKPIEPPSFQIDLAPRCGFMPRRTANPPDAGMRRYAPEFDESGPMHPRRKAVVGDAAGRSRRSTKRSSERATWRKSRDELQREMSFWLRIVPMNELASRECVPCKGGIPPLTGKPLAALQARLGKKWQVIDGHHLEKEFKFKDFRQALAFTNQVGDLAEKAGHHPDIYLAWGRVKIAIWTHKIDGLTESDFVLAAKIDALN